MKIVAIIQARMGSTRLPQKVLMNICGRPMLYHIVRRVSGSKRVDEIIVATSTSKQDDDIEKFTMKNKIKCFRGSEDNVLERFYLTAKAEAADVVVRLTGDNPMAASEIIDRGLEMFLKEKKNLDYLYYREGLPIGMAVEIFKFTALKKAYLEATDKECMEHVTPYIYRNKNKFNAQRASVEGDDRSYIRWTIDTEEDFKLIENMYKVLYNDKQPFSYVDALKAYDTHEEWHSVNKNVMQVAVRYQGDDNEI